MTYPKWLPSRKALVRAIYLFLEFIPVFILGRTIDAFLFRDLRNLTESQIIEIFNSPFFGLLSLIYLGLIIYWFSLAHQLLFNSPPNKLKYLPRWRNLWQGIIDFFVIVFSFPITLIILAGLDDSFNYSDTEIHIGFGIISIIVSAYFYYIGWYEVIKFPKKIKEATNHPQVDPIEQELNGMKGDLGLKKMNDVNQRD